MGSFSHIQKVRAALAHARESGEWVVLVAPTNRVTDVSDILVAWVPEDGTLCGRTVLFKEGGRVTVCAASHYLHSSGFTLLPVAFSRGVSADDEVAILRWYSDARRVTGLDRTGTILR